MLPFWWPCLWEPLVYSNMYFAIWEDKKCGCFIVLLHILLSFTMWHILFCFQIFSHHILLFYVLLLLSNLTSSFWNYTHTYFNLKYVYYLSSRNVLKNTYTVDSYYFRDFKIPLEIWTSKNQFLPLSSRRTEWKLRDSPVYYWFHFFK